MMRMKRNSSRVERDMRNSSVANRKINKGVVQRMAQPAVIQLAKWKWTGKGWELINSDGEKKPTEPKVIPGVKHKGMVYNTKEAEWEKAEKKVEEKKTKVKVQEKKVKRQKGLFVGEEDAIHVHLVGNNQHLKLGGSGERIDIKGLKDDDLREAYKELLAKGKGKPGYDDCKAWFEKKLDNDKDDGGSGSAASGGIK